MLPSPASGIAGGFARCLVDALGSLVEKRTNAGAVG